MQKIGWYKVEEINNTSSNSWDVFIELSLIISIAWAGAHACSTEENHGGQMGSQSQWRIYMQWWEQKEQKKTQAWRKCHSCAVLQINPCLKHTQTNLTISLCDR